MTTIHERLPVCTGLALLALTRFCFAEPETGLIGHWKLAGDCRDSSPQENHGINHGVDLDDPDGARFDGIADYVEVPDSQSLRLATSDFSVAVWVYTESELDDVLGDILSKYDPETRTGFNLSLMNYAGVTSAQSNWRNLLFGIDAGKIDSQWTDCGRPGNNLYVKALAVHDGDLYAATWEPGEGEAGHLYRYQAPASWIDCGNPDLANAVTALAVYQGKLYAGVEHYSGGGSALPLSPNTNPGGKVYRYEGGTQWTDCGKVGDVVSVSGLAVFRGVLYAGTGTTGDPRDMPRTRGLYRYDGGTNWTSCGCPGLRVVHVAVYNGDLYGLSYDEGGFFRYEGQTSWTRLGPVPDTTQVYSLAVFQGKIHVGTWPTGSVFRYEGPQTWAHCGRLGEEKEVMGMAVYNGKLYAGTLPLGAVYRYDGDGRWTSTGRLDDTPDVKYRRVWSMAVYDGKLFAGTLPAGHIWSLAAGKCVTHDRALAPGWRHVAAVKSAGRLRLFVDGECVAASSAFNAADYDLSNRQPLRIGLGEHDYFNGRLKDLRIYNRALADEDVRALARPESPSPRI
ncbi:MAG: hypothetical protein A2V98_12575 [Planctomycetes bacterium RBG_16_64_12]|nr:MAG: hypothetical protein A2V98_12575 [Planctomycetes bacterium RBG_16_64_12]